MTTANYADKRKEWLEWLQGADPNSGDPNSIMTHVYNLVWDTALIKLVSEAVKLAPKNTRGEPELNGILLNALYRWYASHLMTGIRRVSDKYDPAKDKKGERAVYSLRRLLDDMCSNATLITRASILEADGLLYDPDEADRKLRDFRNQQASQSPGVANYTVPNELDRRQIDDRHAFIDRVSGKSAGCRAPDDCVDPKLLEGFKTDLGKACNGAREQVNKYIAHAATPNNRASAPQITWGELWNAVQTVCQIVDFALKLLNRAKSNWLMYCPGEQLFSYLDRPWIRSEHDEKELKAKWSEFEGEVENWRCEELLPETKP